MKKNKLPIIVLLLFSSFLSAAELKVNDTAPLFTSKLHDGRAFEMSSRKGQWTVLFFYPKAGTPGCTKQACAFRDSIEKIRAQGAEVFGVSADSIEDQAHFHKTHNLGFSLIADQESKIINLYGTAKPNHKISQRWTFIIDPTLKVRQIEKDVDPALDAEKVSTLLKNLK